jgi:hypothetical protein
LPSIADVFVTVLPETRKLAPQIVAAFKEVDPKAREAGQRWGRLIQEGLANPNVTLEADTVPAEAELEKTVKKPRKAKVKAEADTKKAEEDLDKTARDRDAKIKVDVDKGQLNQLNRLINSGQFDQAKSFSGLLAARMEFEKLRQAPAGESNAFDLSRSFLNMRSAEKSFAESMKTDVQEAMTTGGTTGIAGLSPALLGVGATMLAGIASAFSGLAGLVPAGLLGAGGLVGTLAVGLDGVKDAYDAVNDASKSAGQEQVTKAREVATAQRSLTDAVQSQSQAQRDVADAYRESRNQLDDLNLSLQGGKISQAQAFNNVLKARRDLAKGGFKDQLEYNDAVLRVQESEQSWEESKQRNVELQQKSNDANAKGVENSDQVVAAKEKERRANEQVAAAQTTLTAAQDKTSESAKTAMQAMAQLSPQGQALVNTLMSMKPALMDFKNHVQDALLMNLGPQIQQLSSTYLPMLQGFMTSMASTMNQTFTQISKFLMQPQNLALMQSVFDNLGKSFSVFMQAMQPATEAFLKFSQVGSGFLPQLAQMMVQGANAVNQFAQSGQLQQWMQTGMDALGELAKMLPTVMQMFGDLAPIGMATLQGLNQVLTALQPAIAPLAGLLGAFISNGLAPMLTLIAQVATTIVQGLAPALTQWFNAMGPVAQQLMGALQPILQALGPVLSQIANEIGGALIGAVQQLVPVIIPLVQQIAQWYATMLPLLPQLLQLGLQLLPVITSALTVIIPPFTKLLEILTNLASAILPTVTSGLKSFTGAFSTAFNTVKSVVEEAWKVIGPIFDKIEGFLSMIPGPLQKLIGLDSQGGQGGTVLRSPTAPIAPGTPGSSYFPSTPGIGSLAVPPSTGGWTPSSAFATQTAVPAGVYGLPGGTNSGGYGGSGAQFPAWVQNIAQAFGVKPSTYPGHQETDRHEAGFAPNPQHLNRGIDWSGPVANMQKFAEYLESIRGSLEQVIWKNPATGQEIGVAGGRDVSGSYYGEGTYNEHSNHVHTRQSAAIPLGGSPAPVDPSVYMPSVATPAPSGGGAPAVPVDPTAHMPGGSEQDPMYVALPDKQVSQMSSPAQQLGQDLLGGILQEFGMDGSVFKDPTQFGLFKLFKGVMGLKVKGGDGASSAAPGGGGGGASGLLGGLLNGIVPNAMGPLKSGSPADAPGEFMPLMPGSGGGGIDFPSIAANGQPGTAGPGNTNNNQIVFNGPVGNPAQAMDVAHQANVPRMRQGLRNVPQS